MKRLSTLLVLAAAAAGCTQGSGVLLLNARSLDDECVPQDTFVARGTVNVAIATDQNVALQYLAAFEMQSELSNSDVTIGGESTGQASSNDFVAKRAVMRYFQIVSGTMQEITAIPEQQIPIHFVVPAGATRADSYIIVPMIAPAAEAPLRALAATAGTEAYVAVRLRVDGQLLSGTMMRTNEVEFPIRIFNAGCEPVNAPCGNAQQTTECAVTDGGP